MTRTGDAFDDGHKPRHEFVESHSYVRCHSNHATVAEHVVRDSRYKGRSGKRHDCHCMRWVAEILDVRGAQECGMIVIV